MGETVRNKYIKIAQNMEKIFRSMSTPTLLIVHFKMQRNVSVQLREYLNKLWYAHKTKYAEN